MKKSEDIKERIICATIELIVAGNGNINEVSTRAIAERANASAALINYHFQTKDNLVEICVQRIISGVVSSFKANYHEKDSIVRLRSTAKSIVDFLSENEAISRISILGDLHNPDMKDNTTNSIRGFQRGLGDCNVPDQRKTVLVFMLTAVLQFLFLRKQTCGELLQFDFANKSERELFIDVIIDILFVNSGGKKSDKDINY